MFMIRSVYAYRIGMLSALILGLSGMLLLFLPAIIQADASNKFQAFTLHLWIPCSSIGAFGFLNAKNKGESSDVAANALLLLGSGMFVVWAL